MTASLAVAALLGLVAAALFGAFNGAAPVGVRGGSAGGSFPPSIYPQPASLPHWGGATGCASLKNVAPIDRRQAAHSLRVLSQWGRVSEWRDRHLSDRAEWPIVRGYWKHKSGHGRVVHLRATDVVQGPAKRSPYAGLVRHNCGARILRRSWWVATCPGPWPVKPRCTLGTAPALTGHAMLVNRRRHWLVWFTYP